MLARSIQTRAVAAAGAYDASSSHGGGSAAATVEHSIHPTTLTRAVSIDVAGAQESVEGVGGTEGGPWTLLSTGSEQGDGSPSGKRKRPLPTVSTSPPPLLPVPALAISVPLPMVLDARERAMVARALAEVGYPEAWPPRRSREEEAQRRVYLAQLRQNLLMDDMCARACCEMMLRAFAEMRRRQELDLSRVVAIVRAASLCIVRNDEPSPKHQMLMEAYAAVMGVRWEDMLEEGELWGDDDERGVEAAIALSLEEIRRLAAPWEAQGAAVSYTVMIKGNGRIGFNDAFIETYLRDRAQVEEINTFDVVSPIFWGRTLEPDSQPRFIRAIMQCGLSVSDAPVAGGLAEAARDAPREMAVAVESVAWDGTVIPCLVRYRIIYAHQGLADCIAFFPIERAAAAVLAGAAQGGGESGGGGAGGVGGVDGVGY